MILFHDICFKGKKLAIIIIDNFHILSICIYIINIYTYKFICTYNTVSILCHRELTK